MRRRTLGSLGVGFLLCNIPLSAQAPAPLPGAAMPGPAAPRPQAPAGGPVRDNAPTPTGTGKIRGRVVSADNSSPLRRAQVRIASMEQRVMRNATTDAEGRYEFTELPAGRYSVSVTRNGYVTLSFGQQRPFEQGKPLDLGNGQTAEKIDFALPRGGVIAGRITDETGEPLAGVGVAAMRYQYQPDGRRRLMSVGNIYGIMTDDLGQYRVYGLMPGTYVVAASVNPMGGASVMPMPGGGMVTSLGNNDGSDGYAKTYYPGTASEGEAQTVNVSIGQEAAAFFSMVPARLSSISGIVRNSQGRPAANVGLSVRVTQATGMMGFFGGQTGPDGSFLLQNIPPGEYVIDVRPTMGRPAPGGPNGGSQDPDLEFASVPLAVSGQNITGLLITTALGATVSGRIIFDTANPPVAGAAPLSAQTPRIMFASVEFNLGGMTGNGVVDPSGHFELKGLYGKGTFRIMGTSSAVKSVTLQGVDITDTPYELKPGAKIDGLEIALTNTQTTMAGSVRGPTGESVKDYVVAILPSNLRDGDLPARFIRTVRPDQDGKYLTKGLPPGDYFAIAMEAIEQGEQFDPAFQDRVKPRSTNFRLSEGQTLTLDLRLQTAP